MQITILGAAGEVTGSGYLVQTAHANVLIDFGMFQGRGAGGQFIFMFPELDLVAVVTSHNKGMGDTLKTLPQRIIPAFTK